MDDFHTLTRRPILVIFRSTFFWTLFIDFTWFELRYATNEIAMTWFSLSWKRSNQRCVFVLLAQIWIVYHSNFSCPWPKDRKNSWNSDFSKNKYLYSWQHWHLLTKWTDSKILDQVASHTDSHKRFWHQNLHERIFPYFDDFFRYWASHPTCLLKQILRDLDDRA